MKKNELKRTLMLLVILVLPMMTTAQTIHKELGTYYTYPKIKKELLDVNLAKEKLKEFFLNHKYIRIYNNGETSNFIVKEVSFHDYGIEFSKGNKTKLVSINNLIDSKIVVNNGVVERPNTKERVSYFWVILENVNFLVETDYSFKLNGSISLELAQYFKAIQHHYYWKIVDKDLEDFKPIVAQYNQLASKPSISEEQRKYIVQANSLTEEKDYQKAIELYLKVLNVDLTSYPAAHYNLALLRAQQSSYDRAIFSMKRYLMFEIDPVEARKAQDKIYEWEIKMIE